MKKVFSLFLVLVLAMSFTACGGSSSSSSTTNTETPADITASKQETASKGEGVLGNYTVTVKDSFVATNMSDENVLVVTYSFTNHGEDAAAMMYAIVDKLFQNGVELSAAYNTIGIEGYDGEAIMKSIQPGVTLDVQQAYKLNDTTTDVEVQLSEFISLSDDTVTYTIHLS